MKVILLKDIKGTGKKDQIIEASDGFARNYLFPRKLAVEASASNLNAIENAKSAQSHRKEVERQEAQELAKKMGDMVVEIAVRAGENGRLYGKVKQDGLTLIPLSMYFKGSNVKVELGLCKGKQLHDKRADIASRDAKREIDRALKERQRG